jgi:hypothetical protein
MLSGSCVGLARTEELKIEKLKIEKHARTEELKIEKLKIEKHARTEELKIEKLKIESALALKNRPHHASIPTSVPLSPF